MHLRRMGVPLTALLLVVGACTPNDEQQADDGIERIGSDDVELVGDAPSESDADAKLESDFGRQLPDDAQLPDDPVQDPAPGTAEVDITVIPDEITAEYVEAVLNHLEELYSDALRIYAEEGELTLETTDRLGSAFSEPQYQARLAEFQDIEVDGFPDVRTGDGYGPRRHDVVEVVAARPGCIFTETILDITGLFDEATPQQTAFAVLGPIDIERPGNRSDTPWRIYRLPAADGPNVREATPCE